MELQHRSGTHTCCYCWCSPQYSSKAFKILKIKFEKRKIKKRKGIKEKEKIYACVDYIASFFNVDNTINTNCSPCTFLCLRAVQLDPIIDINVFNSFIESSIEKMVWAVNVFNIKAFGGT